jgi:hypothetical protein
MFVHHILNYANENKDKYKLSQFTILDKHKGKNKQFGFPIIDSEF